LIRIVVEMEPGDLRDLISSLFSTFTKARALPAPIATPQSDKPKPVAVDKPAKSSKPAANRGPDSTQGRITELLRRKPMTTAQLIKSLESVKARSSVQQVLSNMRTSGSVSTRQDHGVQGKTHYLPEFPDGIVTGAQAIAH